MKKINYDYVAIVILLFSWVWYYLEWNEYSPHRYSDAAWYFMSLGVLGALIGIRRRILKIKTKFLKREG